MELEADSFILYLNTYYVLWLHLNILQQLLQFDGKMLLGVYWILNSRNTDWGRICGNTRSTIH